MDKKKNFLVYKKTGIFVAVVILVLSIFCFGYGLGRKGTDLPLLSPRIKNAEVGKPSNVDFSLYWKVWDLLKEKSVATPDEQKMVYGSISGMLSSLDDPFTTFFTPDENKRFKEDIGGNFSGIGVEITSKNDLPTVVAPLAGTPAEKAGLKPNDIIIEVDGQKTSDLGFEGTIDKIRGALGTQVKLKVTRQGVDNPIEMSITRDNITVKSVEWSYQTVSGKKIMTIKLKQFGDDTESLFKDAVNSAKDNNPDGIIIDLRNNPGGYLDTAVTLSSYFIPDGVIVSEKGKDGASKDYKALGGASLKDKKVVLLVNSGSASASEIFSGALRDRNGVKLVGEKTFGKGSVQELIDLSDGSAAKITVAKWYTPNGTSINGEGLTPDIQVKNPDNSTDDLQMSKATETLLEK